MAWKGGLNCNNYIHFLITPIWVYERLLRFFKLFVVIVNDKKKAQHKMYNIDKNYFKALHVEVILVILQTVMKFWDFSTRLLLLTFFKIFYFFYYLSQLIKDLMFLQASVFWYSWPQQIDLRSPQYLNTSGRFTKTNDYVC